MRIVRVDIDNDGDMDLVTGEIVHWWAGANSDSAELLLNDGSGVFTRPGRGEAGSSASTTGRLE